METNRILELLLAAAVRDRAAKYQAATMPRDLPDAEHQKWRQAHWMQALQVAHDEFSDIARWLRQQDAAATPPAAGADPNPPAGI